MDTLHAVVGIDVSKAKLDIALLLNAKVKSKVLPNSAEGHKELLEWLGRSKAPLEELHVCMEATGVYYEAVALALADAGLKVSVVNPSCIKGFGHSENIRNKNDAVDASLIARYCAAMNPTLWKPPSLEQRQLRAWALRVQALKDILQQEENRLEAHTISGMEDVAVNVKAHISWLTTEITKLEKEIDDHIDRHPGLKHDARLIGSIPGIGTTTVARILGQLGDIRRFESAEYVRRISGCNTQATQFRHFNQGPHDDQPDGQHFVASGSIHAEPSCTASQPSPQQICRAFVSKRHGEEGGDWRRHA